MPSLVLPARSRAALAAEECTQHAHNACACLKLKHACMGQDGGVFLVATTRENVSPSLVLELLRRIGGIIKARALLSLACTRYCAQSRTACMLPYLLLVGEGMHAAACTSSESSWGTLHRCAGPARGPRCRRLAGDLRRGLYSACKSSCSAMRQAQCVRAAIPALRHRTTAAC